MGEAKMHKSLRLEVRTVERLEAIVERTGETFSAAVDRTLRAGMDALEAQEPPTRIDDTERAAYERLVSQLESQIAVKDRQIADLTELAKQAQATSAIVQASTARHGFWQSIFKRA